MDTVSTQSPLPMSSIELESATKLAATIGAATATVDQLMTLISEEREALGSGNIQHIDQCGKRKADCVVELEKLDNQRASLCKSLSLENTEIDEFLQSARCANPTSSWTTFLTKLASCREANAVNGAFTRIRRTHIEKALQILRGFEDTTSLYGPDGLDDHKNPTTLGRA